MKGLSASIKSAVINTDANALSELGTKLGYLEFLKSESATISNFLVVLSSRGSDEWSELLKRAWERSCGLGLARNLPSVFTAWLIEPRADVTGPMFAKMHIRDNVIMLDHLSF